MKAVAEPQVLLPRALGSKAPSAKMAKLRELAERAAKLGEGEKKELIAVRDPFGGYVMEVRVIKG